MRDLTTYVASGSFDEFWDGVIPHSADDGDFPYGGWTAPYRTPAGLEAIRAAHGESREALAAKHLLPA